MPLYPEELVEEIRSRSDVVAVIGARVKLTRRGANYFACCPFHNENTPSFCVSPAKQMFYCFGCGAGGNVLSFLMQYENISFQDALSELAGRAGISLPEREMSQAERQQETLRMRLLNLNGEAARYYYYQLRNPVGKPGLDYFSRRGLSPDTMQRFGLGYAAEGYEGLYRYLKQKGFSDEEMKNAGLARFAEGKKPRDYFYQRVMFPILDRSSRVIGFGGRILGKGEPKYLNTPETAVFDKGRNLYGLHLARQSRRPYFLLCEGYMDVIALHQAGFDCAVATLGTALTGGHVLLFKRLGKPVILCYDSDGPGVEAAMRAIPRLRSGGVECRVLSLEENKDPDEFIVHKGAEAFEERIRTAENAFLFQSDVWKSRFDMGDPAGQTAFHRKLAEELTGFTEDLERENYIQAICSRHQIAPAHLKGLINGVGNKRYQEDIPPPALDDILPATPGRGREKGPAGLLAAARLLLNWAALSPLAEGRVRAILRETDMPQENYRQLYRLIVEGKTGEPLQPGALLSRLVEDGEMNQLAAEVFSYSFSETLSPGEKSRLLSENLRRLRRAALQAALRSNTDPAAAGSLVKEMAGIRALQIPESGIL